ncbi:MAG: hypothetical protein KBC30_02265 [Planctomycetes bacterium]|nr:hypothetical protein [Planctomycetota bacterium]HNZ66362.1 HEAT repeat domain-containing protein [Planctomycetota bacterium]HPY74760.1 HEAT repeat domain-containing protein [Planctomycetota bacterium]HQB00401.1 HEAT repeat domain-containing protein [Planctomycetota bacterium]
MVIFQKTLSTMDKLRQKKYANNTEKQELLMQLEVENPTHKQVLWMLHEPDSILRAFAYRCILKEKNRGMLFTLIQELEKATGKTTQILYELIALLNIEDILPFLQKKISSPIVEDRKLAINIIQCFPRVGVVLNLVQEALQDPCEEIRYIALGKIVTYIHRDEIFLQVLSMIHDPSPRIRLKTVQELAKTNSPELAEHFFSRLPEETIEIQNVIMESLTRLAQSGEPKVYKYLISELASVHEISRKHAAQLLTQIPEKKEVLRQFLTYTRGIATWLRDRAFETMQPIASNISNEVIELLQEDDDILLKIDTMFLGAYLNDLRIIPYITEIIENDYDWWVKISAIEIVGKMKVKEMLPILEHHQNNPELILSIISVYGEIQDPDNIPFLLECLQSTSKSIGLETVRALGKYSHPKVSQVLQNLAQYHENWILQDEAQKILKEQGQIVPLTDRPLQYELNSEESFLELQELQKTMEFEKQKKEENIALSKLREKQEETENTIEIKELYEDNFQDIDIYEKQEVSVRKIDPIQLDISLGKPLQQEPIKTIPIIPPKVQNFPSILRSIPKSETSNQE